MSHRDKQPGRSRRLDKVVITGLAATMAFVTAAASSGNHAASVATRDPAGCVVVRISTP
jgi:hypothetical protein